MQILRKVRLVRNHPYQEKDWVGGSKNWPVLLTFSTGPMMTLSVGRSEKVQNYADVIFGWSFSRRYSPKVCCKYLHSS